MVNFPNADVVTRMFHTLDAMGVETATLLLLVLFLIIGIAGAVTEAYAPGFGIPGAIGIIGFACFFSLSHIKGILQDLTANGREGANTAGTIVIIRLGNPGPAHFGMQ